VGEEQGEYGPQKTVSKSSILRGPFTFSKEMNERFA
jgi:hypothetical protein